SQALAPARIARHIPTKEVQRSTWGWIYTVSDERYHSQTKEPETEEQMKRVALIAVVLCLAPLVRADDDQEKAIAELKARVATLEQRVAALEKVLAPMQGDAR